MTLQQYIEGLQKFVKENPETKDLIVINAADDEGNGFNEVHYSPDKGCFQHGDEFMAIGSEDWDHEYHTVNAVCIN